MIASNDTPTTPGPKFPKSTITLYGSYETAYLGLIVSGFEDLARDQLINLRYAFNQSLALPTHLASHGLWLSVDSQPEQDNARERILVYFDLVDDPNISNTAALDRADLYFKRSYRRDCLSALPGTLRAKVRRMTLHYAVRGNSQTVRNRVKRALLGGDWKGEPLAALRRASVTGLRDLSIAKHLGVRPALDRCDKYVADPQAKVLSKVYFRTRLYDLEAARTEQIASELSQLNESRLSIIRALREAFGDDAFAGLYPSPGSLKHAPEMITELPAAVGCKIDHLSFSRQFLININNVGVAGSNGWKIAEILASGVCLVTEKLQHEHLEPLSEGVNMASFSSPEECVKTCQQLLDSPDQAQALRSNGSAYFNEVLRPQAAMARVLAVIGGSTHC